MHIIDVGNLFRVGSERLFKKISVIIVGNNGKSTVTSWREWRWCLDMTSKWNASVGAERFCGYYKLIIKCCWMVQQMQCWELDV